VKFGQVGRIGGAAITIAAAAAMLAACGGSSGKATAGATSKSGANSIQAYVSCLNQHGVKIALPSGGPRTRPSGVPTGPRPSFSPGSGRGFGGGGGGAFGGGIFGNANNPPTGVSQSTWSAALTACKSVQPTFTRGGGGFGGGDNAAFQAYFNCLKSHGVSASAGPNALGTSDPKTAAAVKTCAPLRPSRAPAASPTPSG
jgi:hypothetical protein